jgi:O-antigen/teichoic acid export membrane protein
VAKIIYALSVLLFVNEETDLPIVILSWVVANAIGTIVANTMLYHNGYSILVPSKERVIQVLREAGQFFSSRIAVVLYTSANTVILGLMGNSTQVAMYGACEQLYKAGQSVTMPINQALYPFMASNKDWRLFYKLIAVVTTILFLGALSISFYVEDLLEIIFGKDFIEAAPIMFILMAVTVVNYIGTTFGYPAFSAVGCLKYANYSVIVAGLIHVASVLLIIKFDILTPVNIAYALLVTESLVMVIRVVKIQSLIKIS